MKARLSLITPAIVLAACAVTTATSPLPAGYSGPISTIKDSTVSEEGVKANFFYATAVDNMQIEESRTATIEQNRGHGATMDLMVMSRRVPSREMNVTIVARTQYAMPILALTRTVFQVKGMVHFTPEPDKTYVVRGVLGDDYSAVWLENDATREVMGQKIEVRGSAKLGTFDK